MFSIVYLGGTVGSFVVVYSEEIVVYSFLKKTIRLEYSKIGKTGVAQNYFVLADDLGNTLAYFPYDILPGHSMDNLNPSSGQF